MISHFENKFSLVQVPTWGERSFQAGFGTGGITIQQYLPQSFIPETKQIHSDTVHVVGRKQQQVLEGDSFITNEKEVVCWVRTADCVPILLVDPEAGAIAAIHAGWKGTAARIVQKTITRMQKEFGSKPADIEAAIGPSICGRCYLVKQDVVSHFREFGLDAASWMEEASRGQWKLDLAYANFQLLAESDVQKEKIYLSLACTKEDPEQFHSYRREGDKRGEQVSFICL